jgi:hypothetical protein
VLQATLLAQAADLNKLVTELTAIEAELDLAKKSQKVDSLSGFPFTGSTLTLFLSLSLSQQMEDERLRLAGAIQRQRTAVEQKDASVAELKRNVELARSRLSDCAIERVRVEHALGVAADKGKAEAENLTRLVKLKDADVLDAHRRKHVIGMALAFCTHTHSHEPIRSVQMRSINCFRR